MYKEKIADCSPINVANTNRFGQSGSSNFFSGIPKCVSKLARSLEDACKNIEPDFIHIGEALQTIYRDANDLTKKTLQSVELIGTDSNKGLLVKVKELVNASLMGIKDCREGLSINLHQVSPIVLQLEGLYDSCSQFLKTVRFLSILGLNIHIESSRSSETLDMFSAVTEEIKAVSEKISGIAQIIQHDTTVERISLLSAHEEISAGMNLLSSLGKDAEKAVKNAVMEIEQIAELSSKALELAVTRSKEISSGVGDIVVEIQFHDNMRQRIEHITNALFNVTQVCSEQISNASDIEDITKKRWGSVHSILRLQTAQIEQVISELEKVYEKSKTAFEKLMKEVSLLSQSLSVLVSDTIDNRTYQKEYSQGPLMILQSSLQHLQGIIEKGKNLFDQMERAADRASMTTGKLSAQAKKVKEIGSDTHILSLNAIIKAMSLGTKGKTLQVLSQEIASLSEQSDSFVTTVREHLGAITSLSIGLQNRTMTDTEKEQRDKNGESSLDAGILEITEAYKSFMMDSKQVFEHAKALRKTISQTQSRLDFLPKMTLLLNERFQQLKEIEKDLVQQLGIDFGDTEQELGEIAERYTMQKERNVHQEYVENKSFVAESTDEPEDGNFIGKESTDEFGSNVELF